MFDGISTSSMLAKAIAFAEGCIDRNETYNKLSLPYKLNNPCDLKVTSSHFSHSTHPSGKLMFADIGIGWSAGVHQVELMLTNKSLVYKNTMTIQEVANHYAKEHSTVHDQTDADKWAKNVALFLSKPNHEVTPSTILLQLIDMPLDGMSPVFPKNQAELQQMERENEVVEKNEQQILDDVSKTVPKSTFAEKMKNKGE